MGRDADNSVRRQMSRKFERQAFAISPLARRLRRKMWIHHDSLFITKPHRIDPGLILRVSAAFYQMDLYIIRNNICN